MAEIKEKKQKKQTYHIMKRVLKSQDIKAPVETFPSDQFIIKNLPEAIRKTEGASKPVKTILIAAAIATTAVIAGIIAPAIMAGFGVVSATTAVISGSVGLIGAVGGFFTAKNKVKEVKKYVPDVTKRIMAKHIVNKAGNLKQSWKENRKKRKSEEVANKAEKAMDKIINSSPNNGNSSKLGSILLGSLKVKDAWDKAITDDSKKKLKEGLNSAKDSAMETAEEAVKAAKNKIGGFFKNFRNGKK